MSTEMNNSANEIEEKLALRKAKLALRKANDIAAISDPIPAWPERLAWLLSIFFVLGIAEYQKGGGGSEILVVSFLSLIACQWYVINKMRRKIEALVALRDDEKV